MPRFRSGPLLAVPLVILIGLATSFAAGHRLPVFAAPWLQFPTNSVTIISDPPPPNLPGQFSDVTLIQATLLDPDPNWRSPTFADTGWQNAYAAARQPGWGNPLGSPTSQADYIWGGSPSAGPDANGRFQIPTSPNPQFLFLRKNFCIPINANRASIVAVNPLLLEVAASPGQASVYYNDSPIATGILGDETGTVRSLNLDPMLVNSVRRIGRNTLAMRVRDNVADTTAGVAYNLQFNYAIDPAALTLNSSANPAEVNTAITFNQTNSGLSGDTPFTFAWDFGDSTTSTAAAPVKSYALPGTYTVTLTMTDRFGCPSAPVTLSQTVVPLTIATPVESSGDDDDDDGAPPPTPTPSPTATPTLAPTATPTGPLYLPETGILDQPALIASFRIMASKLTISSPIIFGFGVTLLGAVGYYFIKRWFRKQP